MMSILIDNKAIGDVVDSLDRMNVLSCKEITKVRENIYSIKTHDNQTFLKEGKDVWMGKPVVEFNLLANDQLARNVKFVLDENKKTSVNFSMLGIKHQPKNTKVVVESHSKKQTKQHQTSSDHTVLLDNKNIGNVVDSKESINTLLCKEITQVHDNIFSFKTINNQTFLKEGVDSWKKHPVVEFKLLADDKIAHNVRFVLTTEHDTRINFSKLGIKYQSKPKVQTSTNPTIQNVYEQRLKNLAEASVVESKHRIQNLVDEQKPYIAEMVQEHTAAEMDRITSTVVQQLIETRDAIAADLSTQHKSLLNDGLIRMTHLEDTLDEFKSDISNQVVSKYTKLKEAIDATNATQRQIDLNKTAFEQELKNLKIKLARVAESGGGTNAVQYANGGYMDGDLTVHGDVSASGHFTGHIALSSLDQEGAQDGDVVTWSSTLSTWTPAAPVTQKYIAYVGNGVDTVFTINHQLNSMDLLFQVYDNTTQEVVWPYIKNIDNQNTQIAFSIVPAASAYRVIIKP